VLDILPFIRNLSSPIPHPAQTSETVAAQGFPASLNYPLHPRVFFTKSFALTKLYSSGFRFASPEPLYSVFKAYSF
jgi:hypothetical protein